MKVFNKIMLVALLLVACVSLIIFLSQIGLYTAAGVIAISFISFCLYRHTLRKFHNNYEAAKLKSEN